MKKSWIQRGHVRKTKANKHGDWYYVFRISDTATVNGNRNTMEEAMREMEAIALRHGYKKHMFRYNECTNIWNIYIRGCKKQETILDYQI